MAYDSNGKWNFENDSVSNQMTGLMQKDNPFMQQARTQGAQASNKRGLLNSSMGVQSGQVAALQAALPMASQDAKQIADKNMMQTDVRSKEDIAMMNVAAHDREKSMAGVANAENAYASMFSQIGNNQDLPADVRDTYLAHIGAIRDSSLNMVEQMYGIDLEWANTATAENTTT